MKYDNETTQHLMIKERRKKCGWGIKRNGIQSEESMIWQTQIQGRPGYFLSLCWIDL